MANHWRNLLIDLDRSMQGASEWWIFHKGNRMFVGDLPDLQGQGINALGDAHRRIHSPLIFERHGKVSRIGDDDGGFWDYGGHADLPYLLHLPFDGRITFRLFEFFFQLADRHFLPLVPLPILERVVGGSYDCEHCNDRNQEVER